MDVKVEGLAELRELMQKRLPEEIQTKALHPALVRAARPIVNEAKAKAPRKSGAIIKGISSWRSRLSTKQKAVRHIGVRKAFYWRWIEFGRGEIIAKPGKVLAINGPEYSDLATREVKTDTAFTKTVKAVPAQPFMRPAFESKKFEALEIFRQTLAKNIERTAERYQRSLLRRLRVGFR